MFLIYWLFFKLTPNEGKWIVLKKVILLPKRVHPCDQVSVNSHQTKTNQNTTKLVSIIVISFLLTIFQIRNNICQLAAYEISQFLNFLYRKQLLSVLLWAYLWRKYNVCCCNISTLICYCYVLNCCLSLT